MFRHYRREGDLSGVWESDYGLIRLEQMGASVKGTYTGGGGSTLEGTLSGNTLTLTWTEGTGATGTATFTFDAAGNSFTGSWKQKNSNGGAWKGRRAQAGTMADKKFLVVLEAHWEKSLSEPEYSFGQMLRSFFSRVPSVEVRQRFFHDEADLRRFCLEAAYLPNPTVLYLSTHGSPEGITVGGRNIAPVVVGESLKASRSLLLLHLGSCQIMGGNGPAAIRKTAGQPFPISGYVNSADWAGSAAIDFLYLDLVLSRGMSPKNAVAQTRQLLSIATDKTPPGSAISPCDLKIV
ncbi:MAG: hypothetical protein QM758_04715 [Armatimonas sp.]